MTEKSYQAVIFDWDGTLFDSTAAIVGALQGACRDLSLPVPSREKAAWVIGLSLQASLYHLVPELDARHVDRFVAQYRQHFTVLQEEIRLFEGQARLLTDLDAAGVALGIATGKSRRGLDSALSRLNLHGLFRATRCADEARGKPDPDMLIQLLPILGFEPGEVLMVGDTTHDVQMAQAAGVDSLAVAYGAHDRDSLQAAHPTALVATPAAMQAWLRRRVQCVGLMPSTETD